MIRILFLFLFWFLSTVLQGQNTRISGQINGQSNQIIEVFRFVDPFFDVKKNLDTIKTDSSGYFSIDLGIKNQDPLYLSFDQRLYYFFPEPGKENIVRIPGGEREVNTMESLGPVQTRCICPDCPDNSLLNDKILEFNEVFDPFHSMQVVRFYDHDLGRIKLDSFMKVNAIENILPDQEDYYQQWIYNKIGVLEFILSDHNLDTLIHRYIVEQTVNFHNPAYREVFRLLLDRYFDHLRKKEYFSNIYPEFTRMDPPQFRKWVKSDPVLSNDTLFEMVYLREAYLGYFAGRISRELLIRKLSMLEENATYPMVSAIVKELDERLFKMEPGRMAPWFSLEDQKGNRITPRSEDTPLVYISFCSMNSLNCLRELKYLAYLHEKHQKFLKIISFIDGGDRQAIGKMAEENGFEWHLIPMEVAENLHKEYLIKDYPVFLILDRDGRIIRNPAPSPSADIEKMLFLILRSMGEV